jgi:hypothetical protein
MFGIGRGWGKTWAKIMPEMGKRNEGFDASYQPRLRNTLQANGDHPALVLDFGEKSGNISTVHPT